MVEALESLSNLNAEQLRQLAQELFAKVAQQSQIIVQRDNAKRTDKNGMSETQQYEYTANPEARKVTVTLRKNGRWVTQGESAKKFPALPFTPAAIT